MPIMKHRSVMETMKKPNCSIEIREAFPDDLPFLRTLALEAFSIYGDYETILTDFFLSPGIYTYVAEEIRADVAIPGGVLMMATRRQKRRDPPVAEILAIAVEQDRQGRGIGSRMIEFAKRWPLCFPPKVSIPEIQLSVAESNKEGQLFFQRHGFDIFRTEPWRYPAGQKAFRMRYVLENIS